MSRFLFHVILLLLTGMLLWEVPSDAGSQPTVRVLGNHVLSTRQIKDIMRLHQEDLSAGVEQLLERYREEGYFMATVTVERPGEPGKPTSMIILRIDEGIRITVGNVELRGPPLFSGEKVIQNMGTRPGATFAEHVLEEDMERLLRLYEENGFPYARIDVEISRYVDGKVDLSLQIDDGPRVRIGEINVLGNRRTKDRVVVREMRLGIGDLYRQSAVDQAKRRIEGLGLFRRVEPIQVVPTEGPGLARLIVAVEEKPNSSAEGILGYAPRAGETRGGFTGMVSFSSANIAGTGRRVGVRWERLSLRSRELSFRYEEPWIFRRPLTLGIELEQIQRQNHYVRNRASLFSRMPLTESFEGKVSLGGEKLLPDSTEAHLSRSTRYTVGIELSLDSRDYPTNPRSGGIYRTSVEYGRKRNYSPDHRSLVESTRFEVDVEYHHPTFRRQVLFAGFHVRQMRSDEEPLPPSDLFYLGGAKTLRGYREEELQGSTVAWLNAEYRLLPMADSRIFLFTDVGHYRFRRNEGPSLVEVSDEKVGYGLGIRIESKVGMVGVDYGLGEGDGLTRGKIHLGLENSF